MENEVDIIRRNMKGKTKHSASNLHVFDFEKKSIKSRQRRPDPDHPATIGQS